MPRNHQVRPDIAFYTTLHQVGQFALCRSRCTGLCVNPRLQASTCDMLPYCIQGTQENIHRFLADPDAPTLAPLFLWPSFRYFYLPVSWVTHLAVRERPSRKFLQTGHQSLLSISVNAMSNDDVLEKFCVDLASKAKDLPYRRTITINKSFTAYPGR